MGEWERVKLDDVCREVTVGHVGPMADKYIDDGIPFLRSLSVEPFRISREGLKFIDADFHAKLKKSALRPGDVVIVRTGKPGACAVIPDWLEDANCSDLVIARCGPSLRPRFLCYVVNSVAGQHIDNHLVGAVQQHFNVGSARTLEFDLPDLAEQDEILALLGSIDDKIELNRRMNETLEAMARAVFKDWFVDFGPTRAKAEGREPYLAPEIWELFPDAFDHEGKPVDWSEGTLADVADSPRRGINPSDVSEDTPYIGLEHMPRRSIALSEWEGAAKVTSNKSVFKKGEFLFGKLRPYFHKVGLAPLDGICSTDIVVVIPQAPEWTAFTLACLSSDEFVDHTDQTSTGTKMPRTSWKAMGQYKIYVPSEQVAYAFQSLIQPLLDRVGANIHESHALGQTRDLLLPKLMSGEIRLREVEELAAAVA